MRRCKFWRVDAKTKKIECLQIITSRSKSVLIHEGAIPRAGWVRKRPKLLTQIERSADVQRIKREKAQLEHKMMMRRLAEGRRRKAEHLRRVTKTLAVKSTIIALP